MRSFFNIGLPRMHKEPGERRDFLPKFVGRLAQMGANVTLEFGYGSGMRLVEEDYLKVAPETSFGTLEQTYQQDYVLVMRCPTVEEMNLLRRGSCLMSMLHYPTRPRRVTHLRSLEIEAISLDSVKDDSGRRLVENLRAVGWNGIEAAFQVLQSTYPAPGFGSPQRGPIQVTLMGAGSVGTHVLQAAIRYGDDHLRQHMSSHGIPGVQVNVVDYDVTPHESIMKKILSHTDVLVDATQRSDPSKPVIPNAWIAYLPEHAVLLDLSVDPYHCDSAPVYIKGIEGIPQGNLDKYIFTPVEAAFDLLPDCVDSTHRRHAVSCYSWPGIHPKECMNLYGKQILPIVRTLVEVGGVENIDPEGRFFERAIARALLTRWDAQN